MALDTFTGEIQWASTQHDRMTQAVVRPPCLCVCRVEVPEVGACGSIAVVRQTIPPRHAAGDPLSQAIAWSARLTMPLRRGDCGGRGSRSSCRGHGGLNLARPARGA